MWNVQTSGFSKFGKRRSLFEEAQEMKAIAKDDSGKVHFGQSALELIRKNPDLYRQLASRYILIGHSMGGVVSREYVQGNFYNGDVDKIITLDSPHEGTGTMNMIAKMNAIDDFWGHLGKNLESTALSVVPQMLLLGNVGDVGFSITAISSNLLRKELGDLVATAVSPEYYVESDPLLHYVDPKQTGFGTIDSLNGLSYEPDSMPMIRILSGRHGMTMSDPGDLDDGLAGGIRTFIPDYAAMPYLNYNAQLEGSGDMSARYVNALTSFMMGYAGIPVQQTGSSIVPDFSSNGSGVDVLNDPMIDVERAYFNAAPSASGTLGDVALIIESVTNQVRDLDLTLGYICSPCANAAKIALGFAGAEQAAPSIIPAAIAGISDMKESHQISLYWDYLDTMKASFNTYSLQNGSFSYTPYLMEDFLYERPFVNLALNDTATLNQLQGMSDSAQDVSTLNHNCFYIGSKNGVNCAIGLFKSANDLNSTQKNQPLSGLTTPLRFHSESDWSKMGVKVDRWEKVDGLHPDGSENEKGVPIRHVERYEVPAITVEDWIEKYSFVVDDLMPHRLRQIRMNFNFVTEIAWECDITKAEDDDKACKVYQRSAGEPWGEPKKTVRHPVKKNGLFDFNPRDYGYDNLFAIQKDNQNTVTISTVNKIGLSNTQRFYYLFKATENLLKSNWPTRDVVLNRIEGFEAYASVLNYQGFSVDSAYDVVYKGDDIEHGTRLKMKGTPNGVQDMDFESRQQMDTLSDGEYAWQFRAYATNNATGDLDTSKFYNALFSIDRVAPKFSLYTDNSFVNPDSANFVVRYRWNGGDSVTPDIRAMRWTLEKGCSLPNDTATAAEANCTGSISLPAMYDVAARDFAVSWDKIPVDTRKNLDDGLYRIKAYALDYAVPNRLMYDSVNALVGRIMDSPNSLTDADWKLVRDSSARLNDTTVYAMFRIDRTAPVISDIVP